MEYTSNNIEHTIAIASLLVPLIIKAKLVAFSGDLGSGKTLMCSHIIRTLCDDSNLHVASPTFNILKTYSSKSFGVIYHYDLYRLKNIAEIEEIALSQQLMQRDSICLIEWPQIIAPLLPSDTLYVNIEYIKEDKRLIAVKSF
jgi:tRNA threonylcarbamoyladenosine biosynthesis protein TsaE